MKLTEQTIELLENAGYRIKEDYSGRGMFGETTTAIVTSDKDEVIGTMLEEIDYIRSYPDTAQELADIYQADLKVINSAKEDSFGKYDIVLY